MKPRAKIFDGKEWKDYFTLNDLIEIFNKMVEKDERKKV